MFGPNDSFIHYRKLVSSKNACQEGIDWMASLPNKNDTCIGVFTYMLNDDNVDPGWCVWLLEQTAPDLDVSLQNMYVQKIATNPRLAAQYYITGSYLTVAQRNMLLHSFHSDVKGGDPLYPKIEKELRDKTVVPKFRKNAGAS